MSNTDDRCPDVPSGGRSFFAARPGRRKATHPVLLRIDAAAAHAAGVEFAEGHDRVTLALAVPASFIEPVEH